MVNSTRGVRDAMSIVEREQKHCAQTVFMSVQAKGLRGVSADSANAFLGVVPRKPLSAHSPLSSTFSSPTPLVAGYKCGVHHHPRPRHHT